MCKDLLFKVSFNVKIKCSPTFETEVVSNPKQYMKIKLKKKNKINFIKFAMSTEILHL